MTLTLSVARVLPLRSFASSRPLVVRLAARRDIRGITLTVCRAYATQREPLPASSLLSQALDQKRRTSRREGSVGPFQLGLIPPTPQDAGDVKKWSELSAGGKAARATARATNLLVILFGAGFSAMLVYALTSELFSKNSPTVLHAQACELIKSSPKVKQFFHGPLIFHNNPPSVVRPRHRNDRVASQITRDSSGREHLLLNFFIQGQDPSKPIIRESDSRWEAVVDWATQKKEEILDMSYDDMVDGTKQYSGEVWERCKRLFRFLSGEPVPSSKAPPPPPPERKQEKQEGGWTSGLMGMFAGLKAHGQDSSNASEDGPTGQVYTDGEVHADLIMNEQGQYEFRYLRIDIPDSSANNPKRVFVIPAGGVWDPRWR